MSSKLCFETLILLARPAAGKSEIIDFLKNTPLSERINKFHIGHITELDDFPLLWSWFEEDAILEQLGYPRLHTDAEGYFHGNHLWDLLIHRLSQDHKKWQRDIVDSTECQTAIMEFSRGIEHGGYERAFHHLSPEVAKTAAILYIDVPWAESLRKNRKRFNPERPDSILEHGLEDRKLEHLYKEVDWEQVTKSNPEFVQIQGYKVPYVVFENSDDVTTHKGAALETRLEAALKRLWRFKQKLLKA
ncbi:MAG: hypothetical protein ACYCXH_11445 [Bellilinea sp.]